jgi:hypothetical protein
MQLVREVMRADIDDNARSRDLASLLTTPTGLLHSRRILSTWLCGTAGIP